MRRVVVSMVLAGLLLVGVQPAMAQQWGYNGGYGYPAQQPEHPVLRKVLIGGALVGLGFLAGRATAPQPYYNQGYGNQGYNYGSQSYYPQQYYRGPTPGGHHHHGRW